MDASENASWCALLRVDTSSISASQGVYVIWHGGTEADTILVGQAFFETIGEAIERHRTDDRILAYRERGLYVTWAEVKDADDLDGLEKYLSERLEPLLARSSAADPVPANLPWGDE